MRKNRIRLTESQLNNIVKKVTRNVLQEEIEEGIMGAIKGGAQSLWNNGKQFAGQIYRDAQAASKSQNKQNLYNSIYKVLTSYGVPTSNINDIINNIRAELGDAPLYNNGQGNIINSYNRSNTYQGTTSQNQASDTEQQQAETGQYASNDAAQNQEKPEQQRFQAHTATKEESLGDDMLILVNINNNLENTLAAYKKQERDTKRIEKQINQVQIYMNQVRNGSPLRQKQWDLLNREGYYNYLKLQEQRLNKLINRHLKQVLKENYYK